MLVARHARITPVNVCVDGRAHAYVHTQTHTKHTCLSREPEYIGNSWASAVARPLIDTEEGQPQFDLGVFAFFVSYMLLVSMVIVNVVLATLLDEFLKAASSERNLAAMGAIAASEKKRLDNLTSSLDPLLLSWAQESDSLEVLGNKIEALFQSLDVDGSGELDYEVSSVITPHISHILLIPYISHIVIIFYAPALKK